MTTSTTIIEQPGFNTLLLGGTGSGKTHSIRTLVEAGLEVFVLFTEPGMEVLGDIPSDKLHWHYIPPSSTDFTDMIDSAQKINTMSMKMLSDLPGINKSKYSEFIDLLTALTDFPCDRTGKKYGAVDSWDSSKVFVLDSLSGISIMAMNLVVGSKPVKSQADWGIAMDNLERLLIKLCVDTKCHFVLISHLEREVDEVTGGTTITVSTLGRKLAPKIPRFFSDVIHCKRDGSKFSWSTASTGVDLKARNLPIADNLPPSFKGVLDSWTKKQTEPEQKA